MVSKIWVDLSHPGYPGVTITMSKENNSFLYEYKVGSRAGNCKKVKGLTQDVQDLSHSRYPWMTMSKEDHFFLYVWEQSKQLSREMQKWVDWPGMPRFESSWIYMIDNINVVQGGLFRLVKRRQYSREMQKVIWLTQDVQYLNHCSALWYWSIMNTALCGINTPIPHGWDIR